MSNTMITDASDTTSINTVVIYQVRDTYPYEGYIKYGDDGRLYVETTGV